MIQPSALPAAGATLLAPDALAAQSGETGGESAAALPFAGFLADRLGLGRAAPEADAPAPSASAPPANPVAALRAALNRAFGAVGHPASGNYPGKQGGKILPDLPKAAAEPLVAQSEDRTPGDATAMSPATSGTAPVAATPFENAATARTSPAAPETATPVFPAFAALMAAAPQVQAAWAGDDATEPARPVPFPDPVTAGRMARPAIALQTLVKLSDALSQAAPTAARQLAAPSLTLLTNATSAALASPAFQPEAAPAGLPPGQRVPAKLAFDGRLAELNPANRASEAEISDAAAASPETAARPAGKAPSPETAILLPAALPVTPWSAAEPQQSLASAPGTAASATQTAPQPRDFAGLIDRLVEAREAAQASLAPQSVQAALAHADFGKVSLQFQHDVGGMTVAMTSTDPDFSRAVQAAAPGAQTSSDSANPQRQDTFGQSSAGAGFAQSQSQQRGQSPARDGVDPRPAANPSPSRRNGNDSSTRGGIFA